MLVLLRLAAANGLFYLDGEPHLSALLAFAFAVHVWIRPGVRELAVVGGVSAVFWTAYAWSYGMPHSPVGPLFTAFTYGGLLGVGSLLVLAVQVLRVEGEARPPRRSALVAGLISPAAMILIGFPLRLSFVLHPRTTDAFLYTFDQ